MGLDPPVGLRDVVKSHFVRERNLELGKVEVMSMKSVQSTEAENV